jgi:tetratricopeptide (TPR) repeat protein
MRRIHPTPACRWGIALTLAGLLSAAPASASEDGGARSTFAYGAGNRALALGGAYAAIADDASGPIWNPAGLGRLSRPEFQASHASLYGLDIGEQYASFAWPSWRWGTGALVFRRFAVDEIERRDDRNVLLGEFDDSETELTVAYGRSVADAWTLGGSVKLQRQSIAGYDGMGVGLDLGVQARPAIALGREEVWARRISVGIALRNVLEPSLKLDRESVADPSALRAGLAYEHPVHRFGTVLGALDIEKTKDSDANLHAGIEARPHPVIALRGGWNGESLTAGAGLRWHGVAFDYVFEDNELDPVHRFGASFAFGPTVEEARLAAAQAEEEAFRRRLAESFRRRQEEQAEELVARTERLLVEERIDEALDAAAALAAVAPEDPRAAELQVRGLHAKARLVEGDEDYAGAAILYGRVLGLAPGHPEAAADLARCREESDRRAERTTLVGELFAEALDAFAGDDLLMARSRLRDILELVPGDAEARAMLARTESAIALRVSSFLAQARRSIERGLLPDAEEALGRVQALDANAPELAGLIARLHRAEQQQAAAAAAAARARADASKSGAGLASAPKPTVPGPPVPKPPQLSRKKRKEIEDLYRRGMEAMQENRGADALRYWELVWLADPDYQNVADYLKREYLLRGLETFSRGGLDDAIRLWEKALEVDPQDERTLGYLARAREQRARTQEILGSGS